MKPSNFTMHPYHSVTNNAEHEIIAVNIMQILARTGDTFRTLSWQEYCEERKIDGNFTQTEKPLFEAVIDYCKAADTAKLFSPQWKGIVK